MRLKLFSALFSIAFTLSIIPLHTLVSAEEASSASSQDNNAAELLIVIGIFTLTTVISALLTYKIKSKSRRSDNDDKRRKP